MLDEKKLIGIDLGIKTKRNQSLDYQVVGIDSHSRDRNEAFERAQNLVISGIVWNLIGLQIAINR